MDEEELDRTATAAEGMRIDLQREHRWRRITVYAAAAIFVGYVVFITVYLVGVVRDARRYTKDTNQVVHVDLVNRDDTIAKYKEVLEQDAAPGIQHLCQVIVSLGGECPPIILLADGKPGG